MIAEFSRAASVDYFLQPLRQWLDDRTITEIAINRPGEVFCEANGMWQHYAVPQLDLAALTSFAVAIAKFSEKDLSSERPLLSAVLPGSERIQVVIPPACEADTVSITIRKPSFARITLDDYVGSNFFTHIRPSAVTMNPADEELLALKKSRKYKEFLRLAVQLEKVIVVAGETGSGKTTFMKALMQEIPRNQRIITIEDVAELFLPYHPNHVHLFYSAEARDEDKVTVTAATLLKSCLRMKPTRILLAELRGGETFDFINIAASGHGGSITSCHAGSVALTFERLGLMVLQNRQGRALQYEVIRRLLYQVIDVVVHIHNDLHGGYGRHITDIWYEPNAKMDVTKQ